MASLVQCDIPFPSRLAISSALLVIVVLAVAGAGYLIERDVPLLADEQHHYERIQAIREGGIPDNPASCLHSYHAVVAFASSLLAVDTVEGTRLLSLGAGLLCVPLAFGIVRRFDSDGASLTTAQFFFLPILLPFFFLLYTDSLGLLFVLMAVLLMLDDCIWGAALASITAVLVRQTHIVWMLFIFAVPYVRAHGLRLNKAAIMEHLRRGWLFLLGFAAFAVFVLINKGVAVGDRRAHPAFELRPGNVVFTLFAVFVMFLPLHLANFSRIVQLFREKRWPWLIVVGGCLLFWLVGDFDHPYNDWNFYLRNKVLNHVEESPFWRALFYLAVVAAVLSLAVTELKEKSFYLLYPVALLSLAPSWLVDPRYAIPALSLLVLFRTRRSWAVEWSNLAWCATLSLFVLDGTFREVFFL
jgi:alpha-1,2-glucosyltransferase